MANQFKLQGAKAVEDILKKMPERVAKNVTLNSLRAGARVIQKAAKDNIRRSPSVDTGTLLASIAIQEKQLFRKSGTSKYSRNIKAGNTIVVGIRRGAHVVLRNGRKKATKATPNHYAHLIEFGTEHSPAEPFMRPAVDQHGREAIVRIMEAMGRGVEREAAKLASGKTSFRTGKRIG